MGGTGGGKPAEKRRTRGGKVDGGGPKLRSREKAEEKAADPGGTKGDHWQSLQEEIRPGTDMDPGGVQSRG